MMLKSILIVFLLTAYLETTSGKNEREGRSLIGDDKCSDGSDKYKSDGKVSDCCFICNDPDSRDLCDKAKKDKCCKKNYNITLWSQKLTKCETDLQKKDYNITLLSQKLTKCETDLQKKEEAAEYYRNCVIGLVVFLSLFVAIGLSVLLYQAWKRNKRNTPGSQQVRFSSIRENADNSDPNSAAALSGQRGNHIDNNVQADGVNHPLLSQSQPETNCNSAIGKGVAEEEEQRKLADEILEDAPSEPSVTT